MSVRAVTNSVNGHNGMAGYGRRVRRRRRQGGSFLGKIWNGIKTAGKWIKDQKIISKVLKTIPHTGAQTAGKAAEMIGLGRRRRRYRRRRVGGTSLNPFHSLRRVARASGLGRRRVRRRAGGSILSTLKKAHNYIKEKKLVSSVLNKMGHHKLSSAAKTLGYGRRRRVYRRRRAGGSILSTLKKAHNYIKEKKLVSSVLNKMGHHKLSSAAKTLGYGRRRRVYRRRR